MQLTPAPALQTFPLDPSPPQLADTTSAQVVVPPPGAFEDDELSPIVLNVGPEGHGERVDKFLAVALKKISHTAFASRTRIQRWIDNAQVCVDDRVVMAAKTTLLQGATVLVRPSPSEAMLAFRPEPIKLDIVFEDSEVVVINKPFGLVVHPATGNWQGTLVNGLLHAYPDSSRLPRAGLVHRLDKDTSGLLVAAKTILAQQHLGDQLRDRVMKRRYLALVWGTPPSSGRVEAAIARHPYLRTKMAVHLNGKPALTYYQRLQSSVNREVSLLQCDLATGRTHQIRVHLESIGHPIFGDPVYHGGKPTVRLLRQALHASELAFTHPRTERELRFKAPLPADFATLITDFSISVPG